MTDDTHPSTEASLSMTDRLVRTLPLRRLAIAALALGLGVAVGLLAKEYVDRELESRATATED